MLDVTQMILALRKPLGMDSDDLSDADATLLLNRSYWEIIDKFNFREKEVTATFNTEVGVSRYNMPEPFEALRQLAIKDPDSNQHTPLERSSIFEYSQLYNENVESRGMPEKYVREGCFARLWPTPDAAYTLTIKYWTTLSDFNSASPLIQYPEIPQVWHEIIVFGAIWRGFIDIGDFARANQVKAHQISLIDSTSPVEAKEEFDSHTSGVEVIRAPYP